MKLDDGEIALHKLRTDHTINLLTYQWKQRLFLDVGDLTTHTQQLSRGIRNDSQQSSPDLNGPNA